MTEKYNALTVVLEKDMRDDDVEATITAIGMIKGVLSAGPYEANLEDHVAYTRAKAELEQRLLDILRKKEQ